MKNLFANRVKQMENGELGDLMRLIGRDDIISFAGGIPSVEIFPLKELNRITEELLNNNSQGMFQYSSTEGSDLLKDYLINFLARRGIDTGREELIITTGSQQALDLVSKIFINPGDRVVVEKPGYVGGIGAIKSYEADILSIEMEEDGIDIVELEQMLNLLDAQGKGVKFIYLVPDYSNPSGARLSLSKRKKILKMAERFDFYIIEDTPYSELNYFDSRIDYIKKFDENERVILLGTFSKFFVPGLRIGWVCADREIIKLLSRAKQNTDLASNSFGQLILYQAGIRGLVEKQAKDIKPFYKERLEAMSQALEDFFPENTSWFNSQGGFFFWVHLPEEVNSRKLLNKAIRNKVAFVTGCSFFDDPEEGNHYMRLSFSDTVPSDIKQGIKRLGSLINNENEVIK